KNPFPSHESPTGEGGSKRYISARRFARILLRRETPHERERPKVSSSRRSWWKRDRNENRQLGRTAPGPSGSKALSGSGCFDAPPKSRPGEKRTGRWPRSSRRKPRSAVPGGPVVSPKPEGPGRSG